MNILLTLISIQLFLFLGNKGQVIFSLMRKMERDLTQLQISRATSLFKFSLKEEGQTLLLGLLVLMFFSILLGTQFIRLKKYSKDLKEHHNSLLCLKQVQKHTRVYIKRQIQINKQLRTMTFIPSNQLIKNVLKTTQNALKLKFMFQLKNITNCLNYFLSNRIFSYTRDSFGGLKLIRNKFSWNMKKNSLLLKLKSSYSLDAKYSLLTKEVPYLNSIYGLPLIFF